MSLSRLIEIRGTTTLVGLLGWPTSHSLSPPMQNAAFAALALDWAYVPLPTPPDQLADAVKGLQAVGFAGANVTIPHKQAVIPLCDELDEIAQAAGSVNTLVFDGGRVLGSSTDGDAVAVQVDPRDRRALVLGTGGSSRAVVEALERAGAEVTTASRREAGWPPSAEGYDILVNATPVKDEVIVAPHAGMEVVDLAYLPNGGDTALIAAARAAGCDIVVDGLDVLLFQGQPRSSAGRVSQRRSSRCARRCAAPEPGVAVRLPHGRRPPRGPRRALQRGRALGRLRADAGGVRSRRRDGVRGRRRPAPSSVARRSQRPTRRSRRPTRCCCSGRSVRRTARRSRTMRGRRTACVRAGCC